MPDGQEVTQPSVEEMADNIAKGILSGNRVPDKSDFESDDKSEVETEASADPETEAEVEEETEATKPEEEEAPQPRTYKVKYKAEDGSDVEAEVEDTELIKGYMLDKSYRQKTAQLAREREALQNQIREAVDPKLRELDEKLGMAEAVLYDSLAPEMNNTDWAKLSEEDPAEWARRKQKVESLQMRLQKVQGERQKITQDAQKQHQEAISRQVANARDTLQTEIPGWGDELYGRILKAGVENFGFKPDEVNAITDPRAIRALHDAMQYRALKAKPTLDKRVAPAPSKVIKPGGGEAPDPRTEKRKAAMTRLQKSGNTRDAFDVAKMLLENEGIK